MEAADYLRLEQARREAYAKEQRVISGWDKAKPMPPVCTGPPKKGWKKHVKCRRCGAAVTEAPWNYCPNCGQAVLHASYAGTQGWDEVDAERAWDELKKGAGDDVPEP